MFFPIWVASWPGPRLKRKSVLSPFVYNASCAIYLRESILYLCESVSRLLILSPGSICLSFGLTVFISIYNFI